MRIQYYTRARDKDQTNYLNAKKMMMFAVGKCPRVSLYNITYL